MTAQSESRANLQQARVWRMVVATTVAVMVLAGLLFYPAAEAMRWGVIHNWTAISPAGEATFRVPFGWRQQEPAGRQTIVLERRLWAFSTPQEINIRDFDKTRFDAGQMVVDWGRLQTQQMIPGDRLLPTPTEPYLQAHYRCSDVLQSAQGMLRFTCFDRDGRWVISLRGQQRSLTDLAKIMQTAAPRGVTR